ncbi:hypothetical protein GA0115240_15193, partial [Streptomyces sp. DvalAA-14]
MSSGYRDAVPWDPNPVIELGNAWITFGDQLYEQYQAMENAQFNLINGAWMGTAATAMTVAFFNQSDGSDAIGNYGLQPNIIQVCLDSWDMGEAINYFALLRSQQQKTEAKEELAALIATLLGLGLSILAGLASEIFGLIASLIGRLVSSLIEIGGMVGEAVATLAGFATKISTWASEATSAAGAAYPWTSTIASLALNISKFGIEFTSISALSTLGGNAAAGLTTDWKHWSPVPTTAEGWAEFIEMGLILAPITAIGIFGAKGLINKVKPSDGPLNIPKPDPMAKGAPNVSVTGGFGGNITAGARNGPKVTSDIVAPNTLITNSGKTVVNSKTLSSNSSVVRTDDSHSVVTDSSTGGPKATVNSGPALNKAITDPTPAPTPTPRPTPAPKPTGQKVNLNDVNPPRTRTEPGPQPKPDPVVAKPDPTPGPDANGVRNPLSGGDKTPITNPLTGPDKIVTSPPVRTSDARGGTNLDPTPNGFGAKSTGRSPMPHPSQEVAARAIGAQAQGLAGQVRAMQPPPVTKTGGGEPLPGAGPKVDLSSPPRTSLSSEGGGPLGSGTHGSIPSDLVVKPADDARLTDVTGTQGSNVPAHGAGEVAANAVGAQARAVGDTVRSGGVSAKGVEGGEPPATTAPKVADTSAAGADKAATGALHDIRVAKSALAAKEDQLAAAVKADTQAKLNADARAAEEVARAKLFEAA